MIKISERDIVANKNDYWISPDGEMYKVFSQHHQEWIDDNIDLLKKKYNFKKYNLKEDDLIDNGWIRITNSAGLQHDTYISLNNPNDVSKIPFNIKEDLVYNKRGLYVHDLKAENIEDKLKLLKIY